MRVSCGFILIDLKTNLILGCHPFGHQNEYDVPKGIKNDDESPIECALRELKEETGIVLPDTVDVFDCGEMTYLKDKNIRLFIHKMGISSIVKDLKCTSLIDSGHLQGNPEMDGYKLFENTDLFYPRLSVIMNNCLELYRKKLEEKWEF